MTGLDRRLRAYGSDLDRALGEVGTERSLQRIEAAVARPVPRRIVVLAAAAVAAVLALTLPALLDRPSIEIAPVGPDAPVHPWSQGDWPPVDVPSQAGWVRVPAEVVGDGPDGATVDVVAWGDRFVRLLADGRLRASADGIAWADLPTPAYPGPVAPVRALAVDRRGGLVLVGATDTEALAWRADEALRWERIGVPAPPAGSYADPLLLVTTDDGTVAAQVQLRDVDGVGGSTALWLLDSVGFVEADAPDGLSRIGSDGAHLVALAGETGTEPWRRVDGAWEPLPPVTGRAAAEDGMPLWIGGVDGEVHLAHAHRAHVLRLAGGTWVEPLVEGAPSTLDGGLPDVYATGLAVIGGRIHLVGGVLRDPNTTASHEFGVWADAGGGRFEEVVVPGGVVRERIWAQLERQWRVPTVGDTTLFVGLHATRSVLWVHRPPTRDVVEDEPATVAAGCSAAGEPLTVGSPLEDWVGEPIRLTRTELARAAASCDLDALAALAAPAFTGADGEPVEDVAAHLRDLEERWARGELDGPGPLLALRRLVELPPEEEPFWAPEAAAVWPYLAGVVMPTPAPWSAEELVRADLYDRSTLAAWSIAAGGGGDPTRQTTHVAYQGWRVLLDRDGRWIGFTQGAVPLPEVGGDG